MKIELTEAEVNLVLQSMAKQPFEVVANVLFKIKGQAESQLSKLEVKHESGKPRKSSK